MMQCKWITGCLGIVLTLATSMAWAKPQDQNKPPYTLEEYKAFTAENTEKDLRTKIKLLDDFTAKYPTSALMPFYREYYLTYFLLENYPQSVTLISFWRSVTKRLLILIVTYRLGRNTQ